MKLPVQLVESFDDAQLNFEALQNLLTTPAWSVPKLINSWANFGSGFETAAYLKDGLGFVHLKGFVTGGASGSVAFTLPAGYRPGATTVGPLANGAGANVQIATSGNLTITYGAGGVNTGLSGITFLAEN